MNSKYSISVLLSLLIVVSMVTVYTEISSASAGPSRQLAVVPDGYTYNTCTLTVDNDMTIIATGSENAYNIEAGGDVYTRENYHPGDFPPFVAGESIGSGKVVAFGPGGSVAFDRPSERRTKEFYIKLVDWLAETDGENVLWYDGYDIYYGSENCENMIDNLQAAGYTVDSTAEEPITTSMLSGYDVFILNNPTSLPASDIDNITSWVLDGGGLLLGGQSDYGGYMNDGLLNNLLENLGSGIHFLDDEAVDKVNNYEGRNYSPRIYLSDHPANKLPAHGVEVTSADPDYRDVMPGATLTIDLTFSNLGTDPDNFLLDASDNANWPLDFTDADNKLLVTAAGEEVSTDLVVSVPSAENVQVVDNVQVTVTSDENGSLTDSIEIPFATGNWIKPPEDDRQVVENRIKAGFGDPGYWMYVGSSEENYMNERVYLKYDLGQGLPGGYGTDDFENVRLWLYGYGGIENHEGHVVEIYSVENDSWDETTVGDSWENQPKTSFPTDDLLDQENITEEDEWYSWDVTSWIENQMNENDNIVSFCLRAENEDLPYGENFSYGFYSKGADDWGDHPYLAFGARPEASYVTENDYGGSGDNLTVDVVINNRGAVVDNYSMVIETDNDVWRFVEGATLVDNIVENWKTNDDLKNIGPGENAVLPVTVNIPSDASLLDNVSIEFTVTSQQENEYSSSTTDFGVRAGRSASVNLIAGWNMIGFRVVNESSTVQSVFEGTGVSAFDLDAVKSLVNGNWQGLQYDSPIDDNLGYLIKTPTGVTPTAVGVPKLSENVHLIAGWNMVSFPMVNEGTTVESLFEGTGVSAFDLDAVKSLVNGNWQGLQYDSPIDDNLGYLIKSPDPVTVPCP